MFLFADHCYLTVENNVETFATFAFKLLHQSVPTGKKSQLGIWFAKEIPSIKKECTEGRVFIKGGLAR